MAVEHYIGALDDIEARSNPTIPTHRVNDDDPIGIEISGLIDGNAAVVVYLNGLATELRLTKTHARYLADLLTQAADI